MKEKRWEFVGFLFTVCCSVFIGWFMHTWWDDPANREAPYITKRFRVTAYCPCEKCCGRFADGITASGHVIKPGDRFVAASKDMKFGTMVTIPGYGKVSVEDRGGAITDGRLDVYFDTHQEALNWGVKILEVKL